jgi:hypothetical protein
MSLFDPVPLLMQFTREGWMSQITYDKGAMGGVSDRVVEPKNLMQGIDGLLVRTVQFKPVRGVRCFCVAKITKVGRDTGLIASPRENNFCTGELLQIGQTLRGQNPKAPKRHLPDVVGFKDYLWIVRDAVLDFHVDDGEVIAVERMRTDHNIDDDLMRAVHAYLMAEHLFSYARDGRLDNSEDESIELLADCLDKLGWRPG